MGKLWNAIKDLFACLFVLFMIGVTGFATLFTVIWTLGTALSWDNTDTGSKIMTFVFIAVTLLLIGYTGTSIKNAPSEPSHKKMSGIDFEGYCGKYLLTHGFHDVHTTPVSGDYGADLVAKDANGVTWVFQCKHYKSKVGNSCVQEVVAAKKHYRADKAAVMTNSQLTQKARELAIENEVLLFELLSD